MITLFALRLTAGIWLGYASPKFRRAELHIPAIQISNRDMFVIEKLIHKTKKWIENWW
jgi:hypothetical protein